MSRTIIIGKSEAQICATCEYWDGENLLSSAGCASNPNKMYINDDAKNIYGQCLEKKSKQSGTRSCSKHKYSYRLQRFLK